MGLINIKGYYRIDINIIIRYYIFRIGIKIDSMNKKTEVLEEKAGKTISLEKKIWDWLVKYNKWLVNTAYIVVAAWALYFIAGWWCEHRTQKFLEEYSSKGTLKERVSWAEGCSLPKSLNNLKGFIFLENAYAYLDSKDYGTAITYFEKAHALLKIYPLKEQALMGCAFAYMQINKLDVAKKLFLELYTCRSKYLRAQSLFALCYIAELENNNRDFEQYKKQLETYDEATSFLQKLDIFKSVK